jgi:iron donor protein CyaY
MEGDGLNGSEELLFRVPVGWYCHDWGRLWRRAMPSRLRNFRRLAGDSRVRYSQSAMEERDFRKKCDAALESLRQRLLEVGDERGFEVEGQGEKLEILFEEPEEARFVISPNAPVRQIWISALTTSFKLSWSDQAGAFVLEKTGETLTQLMGRILTQQLGTAVTV